MQDINKLKEENRQLRKELTRLRKIAYSDLKFDCNNRNYLENSRKEFDKKEIIVIMNDLNGLKRINDTHGHNAGDIYINEFISRAKEYLDKLQIKSKIIRLGGDEFLVLIFDKFELFNIEDYEKAIDNIASCGSIFKDNATRLYFALQRADKELYKNKQLFYKSRQLEYIFFENVLT